MRPRRPRLRILAFILVALAVVASSAPSVFAAPSNRRDDTLILQFRETPATAARSPRYQALARRYGLVDEGPIVPPATHGNGHRSPRRKPNANADRVRARLERYVILRAARSFDVDGAVAEFKALPEIATAEPDRVLRAAGFLGDPITAPPDDPAFAPYQWNLKNTGDQTTEPEQLVKKVGADIHATEAWAVTTGDANVVVAILDTGMRYDHPEFAGRIWRNVDEIPENGIDDDGNGYVDDVVGYNFAASNPYPYEDNGHGTACASILGANGNNGSLMAGVDWNCRLMPLKVLGNGVGSIVNVARGIVYAADNGADVVSMSLGGEGYSEILHDACEYAHDAGLFLAAAMMNDNTSTPAYPAAFDDLVAGVGSTDPADQRCTPETSGYGPNYGPHIDVMAPGVSIPVISIGSPTGITLGGGTSFATPMVAGLGALIDAVRPGLTADQVRDLIRYSAADQVGRPTEDTPGFDIYHGYGRIDAGRALALTATTGFPVLTAPPSVQGVEGVPLTFDVSASDPDGDPIDSLLVDAADMPPGASFAVNADRTRGVFAWTPTYSESGVYPVKFRAKNPFEASGVTSIEIFDVPNPPSITVPPPLVGTEGVALHAVITATDPDGDPMTSFTASPLPAGAAFTVDATHTAGSLDWKPGYAQAGGYLVTFEATSLDPAGPLGAPVVERASAFLSILIREGPDQPPIVTAPARVDGPEGALLAVDVTVSDADDDPITSLVAAPLPTGATFAPAEGNASGRLAWIPDFQQAGSYEVRLSAASAHRAAGVSDPVVTEASAVLTIVVADTPRAPVANAGGPYSGVVGIPITFDGSKSSDPDGTPLASYQWNFGEGGAGVGATVTHTYATGGVFTVTLTVSDGDLESTASTSATVADRFAARAFTDAGDRTVRLLSAKPTMCVSIEPVGGSFSLDAVDAAGLVMISAGTGVVDHISSAPGKGIAVGDEDRNGVADRSACFAKADLRRLFSSLPSGRQRVPIVLEAPLSTGGRLHAEVELDVIASGGGLAAVVTPNPARTGGVLTLRTHATGPVHVRLYDASGRLVRETAATPAGGSGYLDLPLAARDTADRPLSSGIYFYRVESGAGVGTGRVVLVR